MIKVTTSAPISMEKFEKALTGAYRKGLLALANDAFEFWKDEAARHLQRSLRDYQFALHPPRKVDEDTYEIVLHHSEKRANWLVIAIECGYPPFDIKPKLLASPSATHWSQYAKRNPGGQKPTRFLDVPFKTKTTAGGGPVRSQDKPNEFRRLSPTSGGWMHPGFAPLGGKRNLGTPFREKVKEHIAKQAQKVLGPLISKMSI
jgi:hypothetical protein